MFLCRQGSPPCCAGVLHGGEGPEREQCSSPACLWCTFQWTLVWDWEFLPPQQPRYSTVNSESQFLLKSAPPAQLAPSLHPALPSQSASSLCFSLSTALPVWLFCLTVSLIPWLLEFCEVLLSVDFGCLLILDWLLPSFWLWRKWRVSTYTSILARTLVYASCPSKIMPNSPLPNIGSQSMWWSCIQPSHGHLQCLFSWQHLLS